MPEEIARRRSVNGDAHRSVTPTERQHLHEKTPVKKQKKPHRAWRAFSALLLKLAILGALGWALLTYVLWIGVCHSNDMYPAVRDGDLVISYRLQPFLSGNIVSYEHDGQQYLGRIVGLPGDVVEIDAEGHYTVNGNVPFETIYYETKSAEDSAVTYPCFLGEGELFVLNDMRESMKDSREFGPIQEKDVDGSLALLLRRRGW